MAKISVGSLSTFNHEVQEWAIYKDRLEQWFLANEINAEVDKSGTKRRAILLSSLAESTYKLVRDLALPKIVGTDLDYAGVLKLLDEHFQSKKCGFAERFTFHSAVQNVNESMAEWAARVRSLAAHCEFGAEAFGELLRDRFVLGMVHGPERDKLFTTNLAELTLTKAIEIAESMRSARLGSQQSAGNASEATHVPLQVLKLSAVPAAPARRGGRQRRQAAPDARPSSASRAGSRAPPPPDTGGADGADGCKVCGYTGHKEDSCRFKHHVCKRCGVKGHLKRMCPKRVKRQYFVECGSDDDDDVDGSIQQPDGEWMTISARSPDKEPSPPSQIKCAEPLVQSVRVYLATELPSKQRVSPAPPEPPRCDADIAAHTARDEIKGINFEPRLKRNDLNNNASRQPREQRAMPSQAELMQRQPLLARAAKQEPAAPGTDDSDPELAHSPTRLHGEFVVEIPAGAARDERYPKEIWKTLLGFFFLFVCVCVNMTALAMVHERLPDRNTTAPLDDVVLDAFAAQDWALSASEYLIMLSTTVAILVVVFHKHRFIVARRLFVVIGLLYLYRSVTMFVTVLPMSSTTYYCSPKSGHLTPLLVVRRMLYLISGFGLSINGKHTYCGDFIYSGHTMILVLSYLVVAEYSPRKLWPVHWALWGAAWLGVALVLVAHAHYTVDVVIAYYITTRLFWTFHSLLVTPPRHGAGQYMIQREWWYGLFAYLERNVRGPVPRRYDWPLPWPRTKLFSRLS